MKAQMSGSRRHRDAINLRHDPDTGPIDMLALHSLAGAMGQAAIDRYQALAPAMHQRGEAATAAAFGVLAEQEADNLAHTLQQASSLGLSITNEQIKAQAGKLPPEINAAWEELDGSALLSPYRAFATAVRNKQQAASFFTYLAAQAVDDDVRVAAETLAANQLFQASALRRWRRRAWHRERNRAHRALPPPHIDSLEALQRFLDASHRDIDAHLAGVAARLHELHDTDTARFIEGIQQALAVPSPAAASEHATALLVQAQRPLEILAEQLEMIAAQTQDEVFDAVIAAMNDTVALLARIALRAASQATK